MIEYRKGNILHTDAEALVNTVNCVGVMGRGIALQFKKCFPKNFDAYERACKRKEVQPGKMFVFDTGSLTNPKFIINFPTKRHWRGNSRIEDIDSGLKALVQELRDRDIRSIAIPPLGSGLGGLEWHNVRRRIEENLRDIEYVKITIFEPDCEHIPIDSPEVPNLNKCRATLIVLIDRYLKGQMEPYATKHEVYRLMYLVQEAGEPLHLEYTNGKNGLFAEQLCRDLDAIEGFFVSRCSANGDVPDSCIELVPGALEDAEGFLSDDAATLGCVDRVGNLIEGFESPLGLELLTSVYRVSKYQQTTGTEDTSRSSFAGDSWTTNFTEHQISIALETLKNQNWLSDECR